MSSISMANTSADSRSSSSVMMVGGRSFSSRLHQFSTPVSAGINAGLHLAQHDQHVHVGILLVIIVACRRAVQYDGNQFFAAGIFQTADQLLQLVFRFLVIFAPCSRLPAAAGAATAAHAAAKAAESSATAAAPTAGAAAVAAAPTAAPRPCRCRAGATAAHCPCRHRRWQVGLRRGVRRAKVRESRGRTRRIARRAATTELHGSEAGPRVAEFP